MSVDERLTHCWETIYLVSSPSENVNAAGKQCFLVSPPSGNMGRKCFVVCLPSESIAKKQYHLICPLLGNMAGNQCLTAFILPTLSLGNQRCMKLLLESGANPYARMTGGWTPAHCAAEAGRSEILQVLIEFGTPIDIKDDYGDSPRDVAEIYGQSECAELLKRCVLHCTSS